MASDRGTRVLLASNRAAIRALFPGAQEGLGDQRFDVHQIAIPSLPGPALLKIADLAVLDVASNAAGTFELCRSIHTQRPTLPIAALICCTERVPSTQMSALIDAGVTSLLDLQAPAEELADAFHSIAHGEVVLRLHAMTGATSLLRDMTARNRRAGTRADPAPNDQDNHLLRLVAHGLSDQEIAARLNMSPFTVRHHIERLRRAVIARNRVELAAWAGRNGFYQDAPMEIDETAGGI
jgi:DNA-binding NarL/FixJ family response regulator